MILYEDAKEYWVVISRVRKNKSTPLMIRAAINDFNRMLPTVTNPAVKNRILKFLSHNHKYSPSDFGGGGGPRRA